VPWGYKQQWYNGSLYDPFLLDFFHQRFVVGSSRDAAGERGPSAVVAAGLSGLVKYTGFPLLCPPYLCSYAQTLTSLTRKCLFYHMEQGHRVPPEVFE